MNLEEGMGENANESMVATYWAEMVPVTHVSCGGVVAVSAGCDDAAPAVDSITAHFLTYDML